MTIVDKESVASNDHTILDVDDISDSEETLPSDIDQSDRMLQRVILHNFMARLKVSKLFDTKAEQKVLQDDSNFGFSGSLTLSDQQMMY